MAKTVVFATCMILSSAVAFNSNATEIREESSATSPGDTTHPHLADFTFTPSTLDAMTGQASATCTMTVTDSPAGVVEANCRFVNPSHQHSVYGYGYLISGTSQAGTWRGSAFFPPYSEEGIWTAEVFTRDSVGNHGFEDTGEIEDAGFPSTLNLCTGFSGTDSDGDGYDDVCDVCPFLIDPEQEDPEPDGVGTLCDNCSQDWNPSQSDSDSDSEGDHCDFDDGVILQLYTDPDIIEWQNEMGYGAWNVYEGDLAVLRSTSSYTQLPGSNPSAERHCGVSATFV